MEPGKLYKVKNHVFSYKNDSLYKDIKTNDVVFLLNYYIIKTDHLSLTTLFLRCIHNNSTIHVLIDMSDNPEQDESKLFKKSFKLVK